MRRSFGRSRPRCCHRDRPLPPVQASVRAAASRSRPLPKAGRRAGCSRHGPLGLPQKLRTDRAAVTSLASCAARPMSPPAAPARRVRRRKLGLVLGHRSTLATVPPSPSASCHADVHRELPWCRHAGSRSRLTRSLRARPSLEPRRAPPPRLEACASTGMVAAVCSFECRSTRPNARSRRAGEACFAIRGTMAPREAIAAAWLGRKAHGASPRRDHHRHRAASPFGSARGRLHASPSGSATPSQPRPKPVPLGHRRRHEGAGKPARCRPRVIPDDASSRARLSVRTGFPGCETDGGRLPWGLAPFDACGSGQRLAPGLPHPATRRL